MQFKMVRQEGRTPRKRPPSSSKKLTRRRQPDKPAVPMPQPARGYFRTSQAPKTRPTRQGARPASLPPRTVSRRKAPAPPTALARTHEFRVGGCREKPGARPFSPQTIRRLRPEQNARACASAPLPPARRRCPWPGPPPNGFGHQPGRRNPAPGPCPSTARNATRPPRPRRPAPPNRP